MMNGAQIITEALKREGVSLLFGYPGAMAMPIFHALLESGIRVILPRHEQGAAFAAGGYARISGNPGVCLATSGPGATNLVTGIADAYNDSVPLVAITAQVNQHLIGKNAFQETDTIGMTRSIVKHSYLVLTAEELPDAIKDAFSLARNGRPGPVVIDVPNDVLRQECEPLFPEQASLKACCLAPELDETAYREMVSSLRKSRRPCIYAGGGIIHSGAAAELLSFAAKWRIPVTTSLMGKGAFPESDPLSLQMLGMHGTFCANQTVNECDLLLACGVRFSDRVTGNINRFAPLAKIVHIDIDESEINKNKHADIAIVADLKELLTRLNAEKVITHNRKEWLAQVESWKKQHAIPANLQGELTGPGVIKMLDMATHGDATIITGVGQHQMWAAQYYTYSRPRQLLTSGGLGAMGFGLPAAIGAKLACPDKNLILIDGDGSFQMNIQELATAYAEGIPLKVIILNNRRLGMVAQWEELFFNGRHAETELSLRGKSYPDFCALAKGYGIEAMPASTYSELKSALKKMLSSPCSFIIEAFIQESERVLPMIPIGGACEDIITE